MPLQTVIQPANRLLNALPRRDSQQVLESCEAVELVSADILCEPGKPILHAYFPIDSFISLATPVDGRANIEVGLVGNEGMLGAQLILGVTISPLLGQVQGGGAAMRIEAARLQRALLQSPPLQAELNRYIYVLMCQLTQTAVCGRFHNITARLARWLLMTQDRAHSNQFHLTHEFLACMLGVRRAGVSTAASTLQRHKLIHYRRGDITILDRRGLEAAACSCYLAVKELYGQILDDYEPTNRSMR